MSSKQKAAGLSVVSNTLLVAAKLVIGIMMGSVSVISEAVHSAMDLMASLIAWFSIREASKPADENHRYGHGKIENISGILEAFLIFIAGIFIIYQAIGRILTGGEIEKLGLGSLVMAGSAIINYFVAAYLFKVAREEDSVALKADAWHLRTDVWTSVGVLLGLVLISLTGWTLVDPIVAILVALLIIKASYELIMEAGLNIMDIKLPDEEEAEIFEILQSYSGEVSEYHKLRTRKAGAERHIDLHLVVKRDRNIEDVHNLCNEIERRIRARLSNVQVLIHVEPCSQHCNQCSVECEHNTSTQ
jgi:cation diffusion facilitator family transporter